MSNGIPSSPLNNDLVEEVGIPVSIHIPVLFIALLVVGFILGQDDLVLVLKIFLKANILLVGRAHLHMLDLILNFLQLIRSFGFGFAPSL